MCVSIYVCIYVYIHLYTLRPTGRAMGTVEDITRTSEWSRLVGRLTINPIYLHKLPISRHHRKQLISNQFNRAPYPEKRFNQKEQKISNLFEIPRGFARVYVLKRGLVVEGVVSGVVGAGSGGG